MEANGFEDGESGVTGLSVVADVLELDVEGWSGEGLIGEGFCPPWLCPTGMLRERDCRVEAEVGEGFGAEG